MIKIQAYPEFHIDFQVDDPTVPDASSMYRFNTKPDVTPYEAIRLCELVMGCCSGSFSPGPTLLAEFLDTHNLRRHFDKITT